jgi:tetratricopeptide (TPR) repeat protein
MFVNRRWICFWLVCFSVFLVYLPDLHNGLLDWDDAGYILENKNIHSLSFATVHWAFTSFYLNYWAPLTWLSLAVDYSLWGNNPAGYHLVNNTLHALSAGTFFLICHYLLFTNYAAGEKAGRIRFSRQNALSCAVMASLFFALHPLRVESVAWATERKDVLSLFFGLIAVLFYLRYTLAGGPNSSRLPQSENRAIRDYWLSVLFFTLSLCSKSLMITLPVVLLVLDWYPFKRIASAGIGSILREKAPFFLLSAVAALLTMAAQANAIEPINGETRVLNAFASIAAYLRLTAWPLGISPFYVHPYNIPHLTFTYSLPIALFIVITAISLLLLKRLPVLMACWLIYLVTLLPFLGLTQQVGAQAMAGRFTYLAGLPLALLFSLGINEVSTHCGAFPTVRVLLWSAVVVLLLANLWLTEREISFWKDDVTLWTRVIELSPSTGRAYFQRSHAYYLQHDYTRSLADLDMAITIATGKRYRGMHELYQKRGIIHAEMGDPATAIEDDTMALETAPADKRPEIFYARGLAYEKIGRNDLAGEDFRSARRSR